MRSARSASVTSRRSPGAERRARASNRLDQLVDARRPAASAARASIRSLRRLFSDNVRRQRSARAAPRHFRTRGRARFAAQIGADERDDGADLRQAEPDREIVGAIAHHRARPSRRVEVRRAPSANTVHARLELPIARNSRAPISAGASPWRRAHSLTARGRMRRGLRVALAVVSSARSHARDGRRLAADRRRRAGVHPSVSKRLRQCSRADLRRSCARPARRRS